MLGEKLRPIIDPVTRAIGGALVRARITPNALTTIGLLLTFGCGWLLVDGRPRLAGVVLIPVFLTDVLDGATARAAGRVTRWGGFYDAMCDRVGDGVSVASIAYAARDDRGVLVAALAALVVTGLVPYARAKAEAYGFDPAGGPGERLERAILLCAGLILDRIEIALWVIVALTGITTLRRVWSVRTQAAGS